jgi:2-dehydro-3-deoxyphosphogluconate aldolase/(4S)-4-hydroxy-2-oxoglutarate aldolase
VSLAAQFSAGGVVPVITIQDDRDAVPLADALIAGGLPCIEVTFRTDAAVASIRRLRESQRPLVIAAGTVLTIQQADAAVDAGAQVIISPGFNPAVVEHCIAKGVLVVPGVATPSEIEQALARGLTLLKFFPSEPLGGVPYLNALAGPYGRVRFVPTGGVNPSNLASYIALPNVAAVGGTWLARPEAIGAGDFALIEQLAREARRIVDDTRARLGSPAGSSRDAGAAR